ncbi:hypothetical protein SAMN05444377_11164 [Flavobacterium fontis]|uniref:Glycosyl transferase family 8 n=2 Tax=Flavobacterium fontis TaxID=1124188 RepID=A0A1M5CCF2_9FLAO|nr:hypothetical protein SAMN05444377_11164 [Flavobacterium fontis]
MILSSKLKRLRNNFLKKCVNFSTTQTQRDWYICGMNATQHLLFVAFGHRDYQNELIWALMSLARAHPEPAFHIHIFSDDTAYLQSQLPLPVTYHVLTSDQLTEAKGPSNYAYRVKIKILQDCLKRYTGSFLYLDTDCLITAPLTPIFEALEKGMVFMDKNEGALKANTGGIARKMKKVLRKQAAFPLPNGELITLSEAFEVWNSGCIGVSNQHLPLLYRAEAFMDALYATYPLFSMEQIAVSEALQREPLAESKNWVHHYWYFKEFRPVIQAFLAHYPVWEDRLEKAPLWDPWQLSAGKRRYKQLGFWGRTFQKISLGYRWKNPEFRP